MGTVKPRQKKKVGSPTGDWMRVFVEWLDSCKFKQPWWTVDEFIESSKEYSIMTSVGYLFHEDEHFIYLATSLHWDEGKTVVQVGNITSIPKAAITERKPI